MDTVQGTNWLYTLCTPSVKAKPKLSKLTVAPQTLPCNHYPDHTHLYSPVLTGPTFHLCRSWSHPLHAGHYSLIAARQNSALLLTACWSRAGSVTGREHRNWRWRSLGQWHTTTSKPSWSPAILWRRTIPLWPSQSGEYGLSVLLWSLWPLQITTNACPNILQCSPNKDPPRRGQLKS